MKLKSKAAGALDRHFTKLTAAQLRAAKEEAFAKSGTLNAEHHTEPKNSSGDYSRSTRPIPSARPIRGVARGGCQRYFCAMKTPTAKAKKFYDQYAFAVVRRKKGPPVVKKVSIESLKKQKVRARASILDPALGQLLQETFAKDVARAKRQNR